MSTSTVRAEGKSTLSAAHAHPTPGSPGARPPAGSARRIALREKLRKPDLRLWSTARASSEAPEDSGKRKTPAASRLKVGEADTGDFIRQRSRWYDASTAPLPGKNHPRTAKAHGNGSLDATFAPLLFPSELEKGPTTLGE